jgi:hypothetical protein
VEQQQAQQQKQAVDARSRANSDSHSEGGEAVSRSKSDSNSSASSGPSNSSSTVTVDTGDNETAASAASLYLQGCQVGASGQTNDGGASLVLDDVVCSALKLALYHRQALQLCAAGAVECKQYHHEKEHHYLEVAGDHIDDTEDTQEFAKNGMNTGLGMVGAGAAVCIAGAILFGTCL